MTRPASTLIQQLCLVGGSAGSYYALLLHRPSPLDEQEGSDAQEASSNDQLLGLGSGFSLKLSGQSNVL